MDESVFLDTLSESTGRSDIGLFSPYDTIISSSPISASRLCSSIDEAELSGRIGVAGASRLVHPMKVITEILNELKGVEDRSSLLTCSDALKEGIIDLVHEVEELIKNDDSQTCHKNKLEGLYQDIHRTKRKLESKEKLNASLYRKNQSLSKQKGQLKEENKELSAQNCKLDTKLGMANTEREELFEKYNSLKVKMEADLSKAAEENKLLTQEKNELDDKYKHVSRPKETKDLGIQTGGIDTLQERAELNDNHKRVAELEEKLNIANEENAQLTSSNIILKENAKQSEERLKMFKSLQPNFTEKSLFDEMKLDKSIQMEIEYECDSEATVPIKNEELSTVTQNSGKNASEPTRLAEGLEGTRVQLAKKAEEISKLNGKVTELTKESSQLKEKFDKIKAQLKKDLKQAIQKEQNQQIKLDDLTSTVSQLNSKKSKLEVQLTEKEKKIDAVQRSLANKDVEVTQTTDKINELNAAIGALNTQLTEQKKALDNANQEVTQLKGIEDQLKGDIEKLENKNKELNGKNEKFLRASTNSKRQGHYASVFFVLSGASAVGASLVMFHLATCISLTVAALTFLAVGCYCLYKANTALSNVEVENGVDSAAVEV